MSDRRISKHPNAGPDPFAEGSGLYLAEQGDAGELLRAVDMSVIGAAGAGVATFLPRPLLTCGAEDDGEVEQIAVAAAIADAWQWWRRERLEAGLGHAFCRVHEAAGQMRVGEILRADAAIDELLDSDEVRRSRRAAVAFLEGREQVRHMPQLARLSEAVDRAEATGHVTTLFAMQAGLFHVPRLPALVSYAYFEWLGGAQAAGWSGARDVQLFASCDPQIFNSVRRIVHAAAGDEKPSIFAVE